MHDTGSRSLALALATILCALASSSTALARARFGTYCTESFQNGWRNGLSESWNRCAWFNNELDDSDTKVFYFNLVGKKYFLEASGDHQPDNMSADDVDLLFINTHGGAWTNPMTSALAMWDQDTHAYTSNMRLGDSATWGGGLAVLATYACETLSNSDSHLWDRLYPMFQGGLRIALGSHGTLWSGTTTNECGEDFAEDLQGRESFKDAWHDALTDWWEDQDVAVAATGAGDTDEDCFNRLDNMKWQDYNGYPVLRDGAITWWCTRYWDDL